MTPTVLVTSVGAPPGLNTLRILAEDGAFRLVAIDADPYAPGLYLPRVTPYVVPLARQPEYIPTLLAICERERVDVVVPCYETETLAISEHRDALERQGIRFLLPSRETVRVCCDKRATLAHAERAGVPHPRTFRSPSDAELRELPLTFPVVLKPAVGSGARGIVYPANRRELMSAYRRLVEQHGDVLVQELIPGGSGRLHVCGLLYDREHRLKASFVSRSLKAMYKMGGPATVGEPVKNETVRQLGIRLLDAFGDYAGTAAIEFKLDERDETPKLMEINPRLWGYSRLAFGAGINFHKMTVQLALGEDVPAQHEYDTDRLLVRSYDDLILPRAEALERIKRI